MTSECQTSTNYTYLLLPCPTHSLGAKSLAKKTWIKYWKANRRVLQMQKWMFPPKYIFQTGRMYSNFV